MIKTGFIVGMLSSTISMSYAYSGFGICNYGKETISTVICSGPTVLSGTTISKETKIAGTLNASGINADVMNIFGAVDIKDSKVTGPVHIVGSLQAKNVDFQKGITIEAEEITLNHTTVRGSMVITAKTTKPYLRLYCSTTITGSVLFEEKAGVIEVSEESIVQGKIVNGTLEFVKKSCD